MKFNLKNSLNILVMNPHIMLLLVTYFLIFASLLPFAYIQTKPAAYYVIMALLLLFTGAFLAGWFGLIKFNVLYKTKGNPEEDFINRSNSFKEGFFGSIPLYMAQIIFFIILSVVVIGGLQALGNYLFGDPKEIMMQIIPFANDKDALVNFLSTLPEETKIAIAKRSFFIFAGILVSLLLTFYSIPSLFFNASKNPLIALKNGALALLKKPFYTILLLLSIILAHIFIIFIEAISTINQIFMFFALVLRVCFIAYVVVLIFSVYETNFTDNCNNGGDSLRENGSCN